MKSARVSKIFAPTISLCLFLSPLTVGLTQSFAQEPDSKIRTQRIVASFNKMKHVVKEKYGVRKERYKEIRCEPVIKQELKDYSGTYEMADLGYSINLWVASNGKIEATGYERATLNSAPGRQFTLQDAKIEGALLTAAKVYSDGTVEKFEGVFINRTEFNSPTDSGVSTFGLGVVGKPMEIVNGLKQDKFFFEMKR
ncbi:MAG: hypothetical protein ACRENG_10895 [bacterium]